MTTLVNSGVFIFSLFIVVAVMGIGGLLVWWYGCFYVRTQPVRPLPLSPPPLSLVSPCTPHEKTSLKFPRYETNFFKVSKKIFFVV